MKDKQAKYPQLRFKGFTDPWVQRNLSDLDVKDQQIANLQHALDQQQKLQIATVAENHQLKERYCTLAIGVIYFYSKSSSAQ